MPNKIDRNAASPDRIRRNFQRLVTFLANLAFPNYSTASAPANPIPGQVYFDITDGHFKGWNGSAWKQLDN